MAQVTWQELVDALRECTGPQTDEEYRVHVEQLRRLVDAYHQQQGRAGQ